MTVRITVVLEYPSDNDVPRIGINTPMADLGSPRICSLQWSDALREMEVLEDAATDEVKARAFRAAYEYPGCSDPRRPAKPTGDR